MPKGSRTGFGSSHHKWETLNWKATLDASLQSARASAYDQQAIARAEEQRALENRRRRNYLLLRGMIESRVSDDVRAQTKGVSASTWVASLTSAVKSKDEEERGRKAMELDGMSGAAALLAAQCDEHRGADAVPSLAYIAVDTIARHLHLYSPDDLRGLLRALDPTAVSLFSVLATTHQTMNDDNIVILSNAAATTLTLGGSAVTDDGLLRLKQSFDHLSSVVESGPDDWEQSILLADNLFDCAGDGDNASVVGFGHRRLQRLTIVGASVTLAGLSHLSHLFPCCESIVIHRVQFAKGERAQAFHAPSPTATSPHEPCEAFFTVLAQGFPALQTLRVAYCDSVATLAALEHLARVWSAGFDLSSCPSYPPRLAYLAVEGVTRGSTELNTVIALYKSLNIYVDVTFATGNTS